MVADFIFIVKAILLTEALTHGVHSWGIFDGARSWATSRSGFLSRLLACFECKAVWISNLVFLYLLFIDFWPMTFLIIIGRGATVAHMIVDYLDALRASAINKI